MYKRRIAVSLLLGVVARPVNNWANDLTLVVSTDKEAYEFGEPIVLTLTVWNNGLQTYAVATTPFNCPQNALFNIKSPSGKTIRSQRECGRGTIVISRRPETITLGPRDVHLASFNLMDHYPEMHLRGPHNFDEPGTYELTARYHLDYSQYWEQFYEGIFIGPLQSDPIRFAVKPITETHIHELLRQLGEHDAESKVEALSLLRRGNAIEWIPNLTEYLGEDHPRELRIQAGRAIYDAPDPKEWKAYTEFLDDPTLCGFMAMALGKIGNKAAGDALYTVTDPGKYPRSYWLAFKALVEIADPRAREVAARLAESAESPALREMAAKFLRDGVLHDGTSVPTNHSESGQPLPDD